MNPCRFCSMLCLGLVLLAVSGCPAGPNFVLGLWLFSISGTPGFTGTAFLPNGEIDEFDSMNKPPGAIGVFSGELTW